MNTNVVIIIIIIIINVFIIIFIVELLWKLKKKIKNAPQNQLKSACVCKKLCCPWNVFSFVFLSSCLRLQLLTMAEACNLEYSNLFSVFFSSFFFIFYFFLFIFIYKLVINLFMSEFCCYSSCTLVLIPAFSFDCRRCQPVSLWCVS